MEIEDCSQDAFVLPTQTLQRTPISLQIVPLNDLNSQSQISSDIPMTPDKSFSSPKYRKRKGYRARRDRNRDAIKKRRSVDAEFCKAENESGLILFKKDYEESNFQAKHNENQLQDITKRSRDPEKHAEHKKQKLYAMTERLKDPEKRADHNKQQLEAMTERFKDPLKRAQHNIHDLEAMTERLKHPLKRVQLKTYQSDRLKTLMFVKSTTNMFWRDIELIERTLALLFHVIYPRYLKLQHMFVPVVDVSISGKQLLS